MGMPSSLFTRVVLRSKPSTSQYAVRSFSGKTAKTKPSLVQRSQARFNAHYEGKPRRPVNYFLYCALGYLFMVPCALFEGKTIESAPEQEEEYCYGPSSTEF